MVLSKDEVLHLAQLSRIDLEDAEAEQFAGQLSSIIAYVDQLKEVDVDVASEAVANVSGLENVMREDELHGCSPDDRERVLDAFPMRKDDLLRTRGVFRRGE
ncbi:MAG: Asp-tRNA(Asn)/Glu-tRNA(Gln) amidotransferase subunit GatC [Candidatus Uhrbacteria bacterium]